MPMPTLDPKYAWPALEKVPVFECVYDVNTPETVTLLNVVLDAVILEL